MQEIDPRIRQEHEGSSASADIELYTVDATELGAGTIYFSPAPVEAPSGQRVAPVSDGITYTVVPITTDGWEWSSEGDLPRPIVRLNLAMENADLQPHVASVLALLEQYDDLLGAKVYRKVTKRRFLDDGTDPDPDAHSGIEVYRIDQKQTQTNELLEFALSSGLDVEGQKLPKGQILSRCRLRYRIPDGQGGFLGRTCPYAGAEMFDSLDQPVTDPQEDRCSRSLSGCKARYPNGEPLPFGGFPAVSRVGVF